MTTRGQKKSNEATTSQASNSGAILEMLVVNQDADVNVIRTQQVSKTVASDIAKDVTKDANIGPALAKDTIEQSQIETSPAHAKDKGEFLNTKSEVQRSRTNSIT